MPSMSNDTVVKNPAIIHCWRLGNRPSTPFCKFIDEEWIFGRSHSTLEWNRWRVHDFVVSFLWAGESSGPPMIQWWLSILVVTLVPFGWNETSTTNSKELLKIILRNKHMLNGKWTYGVCLFQSPLQYPTVLSLFRVYREMSCFLIAPRQWDGREHAQLSADEVRVHKFFRTCVEAQCPPGRWKRKASEWVRHRRQTGHRNIKVGWTGW